MKQEFVESHWDIAKHIETAFASTRFAEQEITIARAVEILAESGLSDGFLGAFERELRSRIQPRV